MKKRIFAAVTAAALGVNIYIPAASAEEAELTYINYGISNAVHIDVTNSDNEPVTASMKLMDADGVCRAKFKSDGTNCRSWNDSGIEFEPVDDERSHYTVGFEAFKEFIPEGMELLSYNGHQDGDIGGFAMSDGDTMNVTLAYKDPDEAAVLTVPAGTMGIYADSAIAEQDYANSPLYYQINGVKYYAKDSLSHEDRIAYYSYAGVETTTFHGFDGDGSISASSPLVYTEDVQYVTRTMNVSELSSKFTSDGFFYYTCTAGTEPIDITFDLSENTAGTLSSIVIVSGSIVNFVVPDENGNVTFYAEKETLGYKGSFHYSYFYTDSGRIISGGSGFGLGGEAADKLKITAAIPDFPENGVNMIKVPAGKYTIEFTALSDEYNNPGAIPITIDDTPGLQSFSIRLKDYIEPAVTEPAPLPEGHTVYPENNILNILVKNESGELIPDAVMKLQHGLIIDTFNSGGTLYDSGAADPTIKWQEIGGDPISMYISYEEIARASGMENSFGMKSDSLLSASTGALGFKSGETKEMTLFLQNAQQKPDLTLKAGYYGIYTDSRWADDASENAAYMFVGDEPLYLNPTDGTGNYGGISTYYTESSLSPSIYADICERSADAEKNKFICNGDVCEEETEFVKYRMHLSQIDEGFNENGTYIYDDWIIDPRAGTSRGGCYVIIHSSGMINAVVPDADGYVEFYAEKNSRFCQAYTFLEHTGSNTVTRGEYNGFVAADRFTDYYTAVSLPDTGVVLTNVPAREYTLSFDSVPYGYELPENMKINLEDQQGVQTIEIILQEKDPTGDIDIDGDVDLDDTLLALTHYAAIGSDLESPLNAAQQVIADVNMDGNIDLVDASAIIRYYAGICAGLSPQW